MKSAETEMKKPPAEDGSTERTVRQIIDVFIGKGKMPKEVIYNGDTITIIPPEEPK